MQKFIEFLEKNFVPIAAKIGAQKHLLAIRDSFASLMPLVLAGALAVLMNNVFFVPWSLLAGFIGEEHPFIIWGFENVAPLFSIVDAGTLSILALGLVFAVGYNRAAYEKQDALSTGLIAVGSFILLGALSRPEPVAAGWIGNFLAAQGIFVALIVGLVTPEIYFWVVNKKWLIKMPESVPPAVSRGFSAVIPGFIAIFTWSLVAYFFNVVFSQSLFTWFEVNVATVLMNLGQNLFSILIVSTLIPLFWFFGLHGANLLEAFMGPVYGTLGQMNVQLYQQGITAVGSGANELSVWVRGSWDAYVFAGGSGATIALIAALFFASKREDDRQIAKLGAAPGIFMINEPILFGLPVVLNPIYFIPFILVQPILTVVAYLATVAGIAGPIVNIVPWTTPPILHAYLATNGSIGATLVSAINLVIAFFIYLPFVYIANRRKD